MIACADNSAKKACSFTLASASKTSAVNMPGICKILTFTVVCSYLLSARALALRSSSTRDDDLPWSGDTEFIEERRIITLLPSEQPCDSLPSNPVFLDVSAAASVSGDDIDSLLPPPPPPLGRFFQDT